MERGYVNLRCAWEPGCTNALGPTNVVWDVDRPEAMVWLDAWQELFPDQSVPNDVAQPAGAQFAVSRTRVCSRPVRDYEHFRHWLVRTTLAREEYSNISGTLCLVATPSYVYLWTSVSVAPTTYVKIEESQLYWSQSDRLRIN